MLSLSSPIYHILHFIFIGIDCQYYFKVYFMLFKMFRFHTLNLLFHWLLLQRKFDKIFFIKVVPLCVFFNFLFESLHLEFCSSSYGQLTITGRIGPYPNFLGKFGSARFGVLTWTSNLNWLSSEFEFVFFMKVILNCLIFPLIWNSHHLDISTLSYGQMNKYCPFSQFSRAVCVLPGLGQFLGQLRLVLWA